MAKLTGDRRDRDPLEHQRQRAGKGEVGLLVEHRPGRRIDRMAHAIGGGGVLAGMAAGGVAGSAAVPASVPDFPDLPTPLPRSALTPDAAVPSSTGPPAAAPPPLVFRLVARSIAISMKSLLKATIAFAASGVAAAISAALSA